MEGQPEDLRRGLPPKNASRTWCKQRPPTCRTTFSALHSARPVARAWSFLVPLPLGRHNERNSWNRLCTTCYEKSFFCRGLRVGCSSCSGAKSGPVPAGRKVVPPLSRQRALFRLFPATPWLHGRRTPSRPPRPPPSRLLGSLFLVPWAAEWNNRNRLWQSTTRSPRRPTDWRWRSQQSRWPGRHTGARRRLQGGFDPTSLRLTVAAASFAAGCYDCLRSAETACL